MSLPMFVMPAVLALVAVVSAAPQAQNAPATGPSRLAIAGDVAKPLTVTLAELGAMPRTSVTVALPDGAKATYEGVALSEVLKLAGVPLGRGMPGTAIASYVIARAADGYQAVFAYAEIDPSLSSSSIIVADRLNGKPLPESQGPLRVVAAQDKIASRNVRMLARLELVQLSK